jgi:hypothetical protein
MCINRHAAPPSVTVATQPESGFPPLIVSDGSAPAFAALICNHEVVDAFDTPRQKSPAQRAEKCKFDSALRTSTRISPSRYCPAYRKY